MKTSYLKTICIALLAVTALSSCMFNCVKGSGNESSEERKVENFSRLKLSGGYKIILKQDSSLGLHITADDNVLKYIKTNVSGDMLIIGTRKNLCTKRAVTITIGIRNLEQIKGSGAIEVQSDGKLNVKDLDIHLSGASKVNLDLNANNVTTSGSGATEIYLKGQAVSHAIELTGSGKVNALDFVVNKYTVETTGASDCKINVLNELNVHTTGAADIQYRGNPSKINNSKSGASSIKKID
jgi:hypothetical protein